MSKLIASLPKLDGYRMPGEFELHEGTWMIWPERPDTWRMGGKPAQDVFARVAEAVSRYERMTVVVSPGQFLNARRRLLPRVRVIEMTNNDAWMRDIGPSFVVNKEGDLRLVDWIFNAWGGLGGGLYFPWDQDEIVPVKIAEVEGLDRYKAPLVMEGGSFHVDGEGTCIVTEECLLNRNRNPNLTKEQIEDKLKEYLNLEKVIWLKRGVYNDETNGHVDNLISYAAPAVVLLTWTDDESDPQYEISAAALKKLEEETDAAGRRLTVHRIHQPGPLYITEEESRGVDCVEGTLPRRAGERMAASYVNFYIANGAVIVPVFDDPHDEAALGVLGDVFPEREIVPVYAREILLGGGNIHCITQQQPARRAARSKT